MLGLCVSVEHVYALKSGTKGFESICMAERAFGPLATSNSPMNESMTGVTGGTSASRKRVSDQYNCKWCPTALT